MWQIASLFAIEGKSYQGNLLNAQNEACLRWQEAALRIVSLVGAQQWYGGGLKQQRKGDAAKTRGRYDWPQQKAYKSAD